MLSKTFDHNPLDIKNLVQKEICSFNLKFPIKTIVINFSTEAIDELKDVDVIII